MTSGKEESLENAWKQLLYTTEPVADASASKPATTANSVPAKGKERARKKKKNFKLVILLSCSTKGMPQGKTVDNKKLRLQKKHHRRKAHAEPGTAMSSAEV